MATAAMLQLLLLATLRAFTCPPRFQASASAPVPNVVHQPWLGGTPMRWEHVLSMMSVRYVLRPEQYALYYDRPPPRTPQWLCALALVDRAVQRDARNRTFDDGAPVRRVAHQSDHMRLELLEAHGGVYLDHDAFALRPLDELRRCGAGLMASHDVLGGVEKMNNGVMLARAHAPFFKLWRKAYAQGFTPDESWDRSSCVLPMQLARAHPDLALAVPEGAIGPLPTPRDVRGANRSHASILDQALVLHLTGLFTVRARVRQVRKHGVLPAIAERVLAAAGSVGDARRWRGPPGTAESTGETGPTTAAAGMTPPPMSLQSCQRQVRAYVQLRWTKKIQKNSSATWTTGSSAKQQRRQQPIVVSSMRRRLYDDYE